MKRTWRVVASLLAVLALGFGAFWAVDQLAHEERTLVFSYPGADVDLVAVDTDTGSVRIVDGSGPDVEVDLHVSDGLVATHHTEKLGTGRLALDATCPGIASNFCRTDYTVRIPRSTAVLVRTAHGDVTLDFDDAPRNVNARSTHGDVEVVVPDTQVSYRVDAATDHGDSVTRVRTDPQSDHVIVAHSGHGDVTVRYPNR